MTKPSASLPVLYARVPVETYALAQLLAGEGKTSVSRWLIDLIESQRANLGGQPLPPYAQPVAAEHEPGIAAVAPVKRGRGRPRKVVATVCEDGHQRAAEAACSSGDE